MAVVPTLQECAVLTSRLTEKLRGTNGLIMYLHDTEKNWSAKINRKEKKRT